MKKFHYDRPALSNAHLDSKVMRKYCTVTDGAKSILESALEQLGLSARAYDKVLRIARTIADLDGCDAIAEHHDAEAVQYRSLDKAVF